MECVPFVVHLQGTQNHSVISFRCILIRLQYLKHIEIIFHYWFGLKLVFLVMAEILPCLWLRRKSFAMLLMMLWCFIRNKIKKNQLIINLKNNHLLWWYLWMRQWQPKMLHSNVKAWQPDYRSSSQSRIILFNLP